MYELSSVEQEQIYGGSAASYIIYALLGAALYKVWKSKKGRISLPKIIQIEWGQ